MNNTIRVPLSWIKENDYELKILMMVSLLAENNLGYRGTIKTMCEWLGISFQTKNKARIINAIEELKDRGLVFHITEGNIHHISITEKGMKDSKIIEIRKVWIDVIKNYKDFNTSNIKYIDWIKILKVFIYLFTENERDAIPIETRAKELQVSESTFRHALEILCLLPLEELKVEKKVAYKKIEDVWLTLGTKVDIGYYWG